MIQIFPVYCHGQGRFECVVCREEKARVALQVRGRPYGLCSTRKCVNHPKRDALFSRALPHGISARNPAISCAWCGVVHAAWDIAVEITPPANAPMRVINLGSAPDPAGRFDLGLG